MAYSPDRHCGHHVLHATPDATSWHGPSSAEDDEHHDANNAGLYQLESGSRTVPVLVDGQPDRICAASSDEPHPAGTRNARDDGETREKERQVRWRLAVRRL